MELSSEGDAGKRESLSLSLSFVSPRCAYSAHALARDKGYQLALGQECPKASIRRRHQLFFVANDNPLKKPPPLIPTDAAASKAAAAQLLRRYVLDALRASGRADAEAYSQCVDVF